MDKKSIKNRPKLRSGGIQGRFGGVLGHLGGVFGRLGRIVGCLGYFRAVRRASWEYLEPSGRPLGRSWAEKGGQHGAILASKTEEKSIKNRSKNWLILWCLLESIFFGFLVICGSKNPAMLDIKSLKNRSYLAKAEKQKNIIKPI